MKKTLAILVVGIMALATLIPVASAADYAYDEVYPGGQVPQNASAIGKITYNPGANPDTTKIAAIWETVSGTLTDLDDDNTSDGCQVNPPMVYDAYSKVWVYIAIYDLDPDDDIKVDISWPVNDLTLRLGMGGWAADNLVVSDATHAEYLAAHAIDVAPNEYFVCYYNGFTHSTVIDAQSQSHITYKKVDYDLYYHDPAGWYDANVTIMGADTFEQKTNYFEYVLGIGAQIDFDELDWGTVGLTGEKYQYDGNWLWDNTQAPTIRGVGNWDTELGVHFTNGSFYWVPGEHEDVFFDIRVGNSQLGDPRYNLSYAEANSLFGLEPNKDYYPLPIDNSEEVGDGFNNTLLKCHMAKLDFYIIPMQWSQYPGEYVFDIYIFVNAPSWLPIMRHPCTGEAR
jgi:hypothetical protein